MREPWETHGIEVAPDRHMTTRDLIDSWQGHIERMVNEAGRDEDEMTWGLDDYVAALCIRDFLQMAMAELDPEDSKEVTRLVRPSDNLLIDFTDVDSHQTVRKLSDIGERVGWWWSRSPSRGLAAKEMQARIE